MVDIFDEVEQENQNKDIFDEVEQESIINPVDAKLQKEIKSWIDDYQNQFNVEVKKPVDVVDAVYQNLKKNAAPSIGVDKGNGKEVEILPELSNTEKNISKVIGTAGNILTNTFTLGKVDFVQNEQVMKENKELVKSGWANSITGLGLENMDQPEDRHIYEISKELYDSIPWYRQLLFRDMVQFAGDIPVYATVGKVTGGGIKGTSGNFAISEGIRQAFIEGIENGDIDSKEEFAERFKNILWASTKGGITGGTVGTVNKYMPKISNKAGKYLAGKVESSVGQNLIDSTTRNSMNIGSEGAAFSIVGNLLEGQLPTFKDFVHNTIFIGMLHGTGVIKDVEKGVVDAKNYETIKKKYMNTYKETGIPPQELIVMAKNDKKLMRQLMRNNTDVPENLKIPIDEKISKLPANDPELIMLKNSHNEKLNELDSLTKNLEETNKTEPATQDEKISQTQEKRTIINTLKDKAVKMYSVLDEYYFRAGLKDKGTDTLETRKQRYLELSTARNENERLIRNKEDLLSEQLNEEERIANIEKEKGIDVPVDRELRNRILENEKQYLSLLRDKMIIEKELSYMRGSYEATRGNEQGIREYQYKFGIDGEQLITYAKNEQDALEHIKNYWELEDTNNVMLWDTDTFIHDTRIDVKDMYDAWADKYTNADVFKDNENDTNSTSIPNTESSTEKYTFNRDEIKEKYYDAMNDPKSELGKKLRDDLLEWINDNAKLNNEKTIDSLDVFDKVTLDEMFNLWAGARLGEFESRFIIAGDTSSYRTQRIKEIFSFRRQIFDTNNEKLLKNPKYADFKFMIIQHEKAKGIFTDKVERTLMNIVGKMNTEEYNMYVRKLVLEDAYETALRNREELNKKQSQTELDINDMSKTLAPDDIEAPFGFKSEHEIKLILDDLDSTIGQGYEKVDNAIQARKDLWQTVVSQYIKSMKDIGIDIEDDLTRQSYYRHNIIKYAETNYASRKLNNIADKSFNKDRAEFGSDEDYSTNYFDAEIGVLSALMVNTQKAQILKYLDTKFSAPRIEEIKRKQLIEKNKKVGNKDIEHFLEKNEGLYQFDPEQYFYQVDIIDRQLADELMNDKLKEIGITSEDIKKGLSVGKRFRKLVLPNEIIEVLRGMETSNELVTDGVMPYLVGSADWLTKRWKESATIWWPKSVLFNIRNMLGDVEGILIGNPDRHLIKDILSATKEIAPELMQQMNEPKYGVDDIPDRTFKGDFADFIDMGGALTNAQFQEYGYMNKLSKRTFGKDSISKQILNAPESIYKVLTGLKYTGAITNAREVIFRYAVYKNYLRQMEVDIKRGGIGLPDNFGASKRLDIMNLSDIKQRAFWLSNDLVGAYDRISVAGKFIRKGPVPFYSFMEINVKKHWRLLLNSPYSKTFAEKIGEKILKVEKPNNVNPSLALISFRVGMLFLKVAAATTVWQIMNNAFHSDQEDKLPEGVKDSQHVTIGRDAKDQILYFPRVGAITDLLDWFGLDAVPQRFVDVIMGKREWSEVLEDFKDQKVIFAIENKVVNAINPLMKVPVELIVGKAFYPDARNMRTIRNKDEYIAKQFGLEFPYKMFYNLANNYVSDMPDKPMNETFWEYMETRIVYKNDTFSTAYNDTMDDKYKFLKKLGKGADGQYKTPKSKAIYNYKLALKYGDNELASQWLTKYYTLGGTDEGLETSLNNMHPLAGLSDEEETQFIMQMNTDERYRLLMAEQYYYQLVGGVSAKSEGEGFLNYIKGTFENTLEDAQDTANDLTN